MTTSTPTHGHYEAGKGFYDSGLRGWIKDPAKLTDTLPQKQYHATESELARLRGDQPFKENSEMEQLIRLRETDRPAFDQLARGGRRMSLGMYEEEKAKAADPTPQDAA